MGNSKLFSNQKLQDTGKLTETPETDALQEEFNRRWRSVTRTDAEAADRASQHTDMAMNHARSLERRLREAEEMLQQMTIVAREQRKRAEAAERKLQGPVGAFDDDF